MQISYFFQGHTGLKCRSVWLCLLHKKDWLFWFFIYWIVFLFDFALTRIRKYPAGQIVIPHYRKVFTRVSRSYFARSAYGVLTGKRWVVCPIHYNYSRLHVLLILVQVWIFQTVIFNWIYLFSCVFLFLKSQNFIYFGDQASFNNALDVHPIQRVLVSLP